MKQTGYFLYTGLYGAIFVKLEGAMTPPEFRKTKIFRVVEEKYSKRSKNAVHLQAESVFSYKTIGNEG